MSLYHITEIASSWKLSEEDITAINHLIMDRYANRTRRNLVVWDAGRTMEIDNFRPSTLMALREEIK